MKMILCGFCLVTMIALLSSYSAASSGKAPEFALSIPAGRSGGQPLDGRMFLLLSTDPAAEPRMQISLSPNTQMVFGVDVDSLPPGQIVNVDERAYGFPVRSLRDVKPGEYFVQAVFHRYETFHRADGHTVKLPMDRGEGQHWNLAPGNLYSRPAKITIGPETDRTLLVLDQEIPPITPPADTKDIRHIKIKSEVLSKFWGRPMYIGANVLVPEGFDEHPNARYPLMFFKDHFIPDFDGFRPEPPDPDLKPDYSERFHISGYNRIQQEEAHKFYQQWTGPNFPRVLIVKLAHANPYYDDSYAVNSANVGPYGDAIETELIPAIEKQFRGLGQGWARFTYGGSTGGWEALAVQTFYPDHYNGAFVACPDPVDFRAYTMVNHLQGQERLLSQGAHRRMMQPRHAQLPGPDPGHSARA